MMETDHVDTGEGLVEDEATAPEPTPPTKPSLREKGRLRTHRPCAKKVKVEDICYATRIPVASLVDPYRHAFMLWDELPKKVKGRRLPVALEEARKAWVNKDLLDAAAILRRKYAMSLEDSFSHLCKIGEEIATTRNPLQIRDACHQAYYECTSYIIGSGLNPLPTDSGYLVTQGIYREWCERIASFISAATHVEHNHHFVKTITIQMYRDWEITLGRSQFLECIRLLCPDGAKPSQTLLRDVLVRAELIATRFPPFEFDHTPRMALDPAYTNSFWLQEMWGKVVLEDRRIEPFSDRIFR